MLRAAHDETNTHSSLAQLINYKHAKCFNFYDAINIFKLRLLCNINLNG